MLEGTIVSSEELLQIKVEKICVNPYQPRRQFAKEELDDLAASIKAVGLIHPPVVRPIENGLYELISGERRYRALCLVGYKTIPVIVRQTNHSQSAQAALIENVQRVDLNCIEIAQALRSLMVEFGFTQEDLSQKVGKKRSTVANYLRLLSLPKHIQEAVSKGAVSMGHAKAILSLEKLEQQNLLYELILRHELNVRKTEAAANRFSHTKGDKPQKRGDIHLHDLTEQLQNKLGTKVTIKGSGSKGKIILEFYSLDDLDQLLKNLGISI